MYCIHSLHYLYSLHHIPDPFHRVAYNSYDSTYKAISYAIVCVGKRASTTTSHRSLEGGMATNSDTLSSAMQKISLADGVHKTSLTGFRSTVGETHGTAACKKPGTYADNLRQESLKALELNDLHASPTVECPGVQLIGPEFLCESEEIGNLRTNDFNNSPSWHKEMPHKETPGCLGDKSLSHYAACLGTRVRPDAGNALTGCGMLARTCGCQMDGECPCCPQVESPSSVGRLCLLSESATALCCQRRVEMIPAKYGTSCVSIGDGDFMPDHNNQQITQDLGCPIISVPLKNDVVAADQECEADISTVTTGNGVCDSRSWLGGTAGKEHGEVASQHYAPASSGPEMQGEIPSKVAGSVLISGGRSPTGTACSPDESNAAIEHSTSSSDCMFSSEENGGGPYLSNKDGNVLPGHDQLERSNSCGYQGYGSGNTNDSNYKDDDSSSSSSDEEPVPLFQRIKASQAAMVTTREKRSRESSARNKKQSLGITDSAMSTEKVCELTEYPPRRFDELVPVPKALNNDVTLVPFKECNVISKWASLESSNNACKVHPGDKQKTTGLETVPIESSAGIIPMYANKKIASCGSVSSPANITAHGISGPLSSCHIATGKEGRNCSALTSSVLTDKLSGADKKQAKSKTSKCGDSADRPIVLD